MTTANTPAVIRAWRAFRRWRRSRPFWGGYFAILGGVEIFATTQSIQGFEIKLGFEGFLSILIPLMLVLGGLLAWFSPGQRHFYGILTVFVAVFSLIGVNFGGFFIGMLFGIIGGGLTFAWNPTRTIPTADADPADGPGSADDGPAGRHAVPETRMDDLLDGREGAEQHVPHQRPAAPEEQDPDQLPHRSPRMLAVIVPLAVLATGLVALRGMEPVYAGCAPPRTVPTATAPAPTASATTAAPETPAPTEPAPTEPAPTEPAATEPAPTPTAAAAAAETSTSDNGGLVGGVLDILTGILGGGQQIRTAVEDPTPAPTSTATITPEPSPDDCPDPAPKPSENVAKQLDTPANQGDVAVKPGRMQGTQVTMVNLVFQGVIDLPTATGTHTVLKFTMDSSTTDDFTLRIYGGSRDLLQSTKTLTVKQNVVFYTSRFQGNLFGLLPVDYTPTNPPPAIPLPLVFFTNPDIQLVLVNTNILTAKPMLSMKFVAAE